MIRQQQEDEAARDFGMPEDSWSDISERADSAGISVELFEDGWLLQAVVRRS